jgi:hypothetical protein
MPSWLLPEYLLSEYTGNCKQVVGGKVLIALAFVWYYCWVTKGFMLYYVDHHVIIMEPLATKECFQMQEHMKITWC